MSSEAVLGIDFGSQRITAYVSCGTQRSVVSDEAGNRFIDACLYCGDGEMVVGSPVKQLARSSPSNVIYHPLQYLDGRSDPRYSNQIASMDADGYPLFAIPESDPLPLETVLTELFKKVLALSSLPFHKKPCIAVIAVSPDLSETHRNYILRCAKKAKLPNPSILASHLCAAVHYEQTHSPMMEGTLVVVDVPANTASLAMLHIHEGLYRTFALQRLAVSVGDQMDDALFAFALRDASRRVSPEVAESKRARAKLSAETHRAKEALSNTNNTTITVESLFDGRDYSLSVTQARFDMLTHAITDILATEVKKQLEATSLRPEDVSAALLIGGCALVPSVRDTLRGIFGGKLVETAHCDESVAEGAAIQAQMRYDHKLRKALPVIQTLTMGIVCVVGEQKCSLVSEGTAIPTKGEATMHVDSETRCLEFYGESHGETTLIGKLETESTLGEKDVHLSFVANAIDGVKIRIQVKAGATLESEYMVNVKESHVCKQTNDNSYL